MLTSEILAILAGSVILLAVIITFAVNHDKGKIPFRTNIIINKVFTGPTATSDWLLTLRKSTRNLFEICIKKPILNLG